MSHGKKKKNIYIYISRSDNLINPMKTFKKSFLKKFHIIRKKKNLMVLYLPVSAV